MLGADLFDRGWQNVAAAAAQHWLKTATLATTQHVLRSILLVLL
jgi:hypothetical protein